MSAAVLERLLDALGPVRAVVMERLARGGGVEDFMAWLSGRIAAIDRALSRQMDEIVGNPRFQAMESVWRGLAYLVAETRPHLLPAAHSPNRIRFAPGRPGIRIRILSAERREWEEDFTQMGTFDRSRFWTEVFAREFDTAGGEPFGLMLCDYQVEDRESAQLLREFSAAAMGGFCPVLFRASPRLFGVEDFSRLGRRPPEWRPDAATDMEDFRRRPEAAFAAIMLPDMRLREPHRLDGGAAWPYREKLDATGRRGALWGHAGWAYLVSVALTFADTGWVYSLDRRADSMAPSPLSGRASRPMAVETHLGSAAAVRLSEMGCCVAYAGRDGEGLDFIRPATMLRVPESFRSEPSGWLPSGDSLPAVLAVSRMAHFLKTAARERAGTFSANAPTIQQTFSGWLKDYVSDRDGDPARPLARQEVTVLEQEKGGPGSFSVGIKLWLKPVWGRRREGQFSFPLAVGGG